MPDRREFLGIVGMLTVGGTLAAGTLAAPASAAPVVTQVGAAEVAQLTEAVRFLRSQARRFGHDAVRDAALGQAQRGRALLAAAQSAEVRGQLRAAVDDLVELAATSAKDVRRQS